ncbi:putative N6-adenine-specific DNA methylase [Limnobacter thiooxidans]|uniref:Class I SAM-dependent RNA methyltransferase n=1 Tax=Limnobacter thiooxidans TaxID=131080 RepID=A0AA86JJ47_9BURK|nr:THUMP domain-containing protein [Limnobacter sp.]MCZ8014110.1 THUMP domain-containing protein [Limnobacter sp.]RZS38196.1 putative N6-adenine-specific DNA methylase [Limnobacter thiooxidans]BET25357.1 class I SAM-dependent RNA methyltransferase [Limnobacter thiooxidans]
MPSSNPNHSNPGKAGQQHNSTKQSVFKCFASCPRGLEEILVAELETMGAQKTRAVTGGCTFEASWRQATRMTYWTRFAGRIGLELARGECSSEDQFYNIAKSVDWYNWFKLSNTFRVDLNNLGADLQSVRFTQLRLKDAVCDSFLERFDERPNVSVEAPDVRIFAAITPTEAMVYIDLAGENLFKRGWREEAGVAPLKENLAAGLWHIARQSEAGKNANVFLDPFCGSGTLVIESLSQLCDRAPGLERPFAFENLKPFTPEWGRDLQEDANKRFNAGLDKAIKSPWFQWYASDITEVLISIAKENLAQAGFEELLDAGIVQFAQRDALTVEPPAETGIVFSNPPYGERVRAKGADVPEDEAYERLFKAYGDHLKMNFSGWTAFLFSGDLEIKKTLGLSPKRKRPLFNGPIECRLFEIPLTRGVYRPRAAGTDGNTEGNAEAGSNPAQDDQAED